MRQIKKKSKTPKLESIKDHSDEKNIEKLIVLKSSINFPFFSFFYLSISSQFYACLSLTR